MTMPTPRAQTVAIPPLDLKFSDSIAQQAPPQLPPQAAALPASVASAVSQFWTAFQAAGGAYQTLSTGYLSIWESVQYPQEYRQGKAQEFMAATFAKQAADLQAAETALKAARTAVRVGTTPALLADPATHELKLMNARESVRLMLEGLGPIDCYNALKRLFEEAVTDNSDPATAYFIGATPAYKYLLRDDLLRLDFQFIQVDMLKRLLPPTAQPYFDAVPVLDELQKALDMATATRYFTAKDNGVMLPEFPKGFVQPAVTP